MERNPSLLSAIFEGGQPPQVDVNIRIDKRTIEEIVVAAVLTAVIIFFLHKHLFKS
ncbi:MAG: hypothetical protein ACXVJE_19525 [Mucilaginibacter sp.]